MLCLLYFLLAVATSANTHIFAVHLSMTFGGSSSQDIRATATNATHTILRQHIEAGEICTASDEYHISIAQYGNLNLQTLDAMVTCCNASEQAALAASLELNSSFETEFILEVNSNHHAIIQPESVHTFIAAIVSVSSSLSPDTTPGAGRNDSLMVQTNATSTGPTTNNQSEAADPSDDGLWRWFLFLFLMIVIAAGLLSHYNKHRGGAAEDILFQHQLAIAGRMSIDEKAKIFTPPQAGSGHRPAVSKDEYDTPVVSIDIRFDTNRGDILSTAGRAEMSMPPAAAYKAAVEDIEEEKEGQQDQEPTGTARQTSAGANDQYEFMKWLELLDLKDYYTELVGSGYTCAADLAKISEQSELVDIGIDDEEDRLTLWCEIKALKVPETIELPEPR